MNVPRDIWNYPNSFTLRDKSSPDNLPNTVELGCYVAAALQFLRPLFSKYSQNESHKNPKTLCGLLAELAANPVSHEKYSEIVSELENILKISLGNLGDSMELVTLILKELEKDSNEISSLFSCDVQICRCPVEFREVISKKYVIFPLSVTNFDNWHIDFRNLFAAYCQHCNQKKYNFTNSPEFIFVYFTNTGSVSPFIYSTSYILREEVKCKDTSYSPIALLDSSGNHANALINYSNSWYLFDSLSASGPIHVQAVNQMRKYNFKGMCLQKKVIASSYQPYSSHNQNYNYQQNHNRHQNYNYQQNHNHQNHDNQNRRPSSTANNYPKEVLAKLVSLIKFVRIAILSDNLPEEESILPFLFSQDRSKEEIYDVLLSASTSEDGPETDVSMLLKTIVQKLETSDSWSKSFLLRLSCKCGHKKQIPFIPTNEHLESYLPNDLQRHFPVKCVKCLQEMEASYPEKLIVIAMRDGLNYNLCKNLELKIVDTLYTIDAILLCDRLQREVLPITKPFPAFVWEKTVRAFVFSNNGKQTERM